MSSKKKKGGKGGGEKKKFRLYQQLSNQAVHDFQSGNHRASADHYLASLQALDGTNQYQANRWQIFTGYTSILREKFFPPSQSDFDALQVIIATKSELRLFRSEAALTIGLLHWDAGDRQKAADFYREAIHIGRKCTPEELGKTFITTIVPNDANPNVNSLRLGPKPVREIVDGVIKTATENLAILQAPREHKLAPDSRSKYRSDGTTIPKDVRASRLLSSGGALTITEEQYDRLLSSGGDKCDYCQKMLAELGIRQLLQCSRCKKAYYCSSKCASKQWKAGHKAACRDVGEFEPGDFVRLRGLVSIPEYNGAVVKVVGPAPNQEGRWEVRADGTDPNVNSMSVSGENLEQLRPLV
mmetsp:Transcript_12231/g.26451  ORF Transcript_12231/g.26451 Transcript_12231/m.26451 type:complete len:356 (+) Transcript_12231:204-1271(+)